jgi:hypothetical protein
MDLKKDSTMDSNKRREPFATFEKMEEHLAWEKCCMLSLEILCRTRNTSKPKKSDGECHPLK